MSGPVPRNSGRLQDIQSRRRQVQPAQCGNALATLPADTRPRPPRDHFARLRPGLWGPARPLADAGSPVSNSDFVGWPRRHASTSTREPGTSARHDASPVPRQHARRVCTRTQERDRGRIKRRDGRAGRPGSKTTRHILTMRHFPATPSSLPHSDRSPADGNARPRVLRASWTRPNRASLESGRGAPPDRAQLSPTRFPQPGLDTQPHSRALAACGTARRSELANR
ncbi:hypothetical protein K466DRAFT_400250 [Polyporus arcularius HHB13444]|uniref:Uncharacterized protein n=1 Tax=Polyporus arcularius HHB13444 TaxID=1314778 RepID=A0A5C3NUI7_9APHY|nr:hypothetical protein K466DRAFT_400250 [Polyporus arcularius HHB13444]